MRLFTQHQLNAMLLMVGGFVMVAADILEHDDPSSLPPMWAVGAFFWIAGAIYGLFAFRNSSPSGDEEI